MLFDGEHFNREARVDMDEVNKMEKQMLDADKRRIKDNEKEEQLSKNRLNKRLEILRKKMNDDGSSS